jgi:hypothetical protein
MKAVIIPIVIIIFSGCCKQKSNSSIAKPGQVVYSGKKYDVVRIDDTTYLALPGLNYSKQGDPFLIKKEGGIYSISSNKE